MSRRTIIKHLKNKSITLKSLVKLQKQKRLNNKELTLIPSLYDDLLYRQENQYKRAEKEAAKRGEKIIISPNLDNGNPCCCMSKKYLGRNCSNYPKPTEENSIKYKTLYDDTKPVIVLSYTQKNMDHYTAWITPEFSNHKYPHETIRKKFLNSKSLKVQNKYIRRRNIMFLWIIFHEVNELVQSYKLIEYYRKRNYKDSEIVKLLKTFKLKTDISHITGSIDNHRPGVVDKDIKWFEEFKLLHSHEGFRSPPDYHPELIKISHWKNKPKKPIDKPDSYWIEYFKEYNYDYLLKE